MENKINCDDEDALESNLEGIGPWVKGKTIGRGAHGIVYVGQIQATGEKVAVKQMQIDGMSEGELKCLRNEIRLIKAMEHPNIVKYLGTETAGIMLNIFLELVEGGSLRRYLQKHGSLSEIQASHFTRQVLTGLQYLHSKGIAHRDIKGANILLARSGVVKLADFGSSKYMGQESMISGLKGTPHWMAPEVIRGQQCNEQGWLRADVWSVGCTALEMMTGQKPWPQYANPMAAMYHIASGNPPPIPDKLSSAAQDFIRTCCCASPESRPMVSELLTHQFIQLSMSTSASLNLMLMQDIDLDLSLSDVGETLQHLGNEQGVSITPVTVPSPFKATQDGSLTLKEGEGHNHPVEFRGSKSGNDSSGGKKKKGKKGTKHRKKGLDLRRRQSSFGPYEEKDEMHMSVTVNRHIHGHLYVKKQSGGKGIRRQRSDANKDSRRVGGETHTSECIEGHDPSSITYGHPRRKEYQLPPAPPPRRFSPERRHLQREQLSDRQHQHATPLLEEAELSNSSDLMYSPCNQDLYRCGRELAMSDTIRMGEKNLQKQCRAQHTHSGFGVYSNESSPASERNSQVYGQSFHDDYTPVARGRKQFNFSPPPDDSSHNQEPISCWKSSLPRIDSNRSTLTQKSCFSNQGSFNEQLSPFSSASSSPPPHKQKRPTGPLTGEYLDQQTTTIDDAYSKDPLFNATRSNVRQQALMDLAQNEAAALKHYCRRLPSRAQSAEVATAGLTPLDGSYNATHKLISMENGDRRLPHRHTTSAPAKAQDFLQKFPPVPNKPSFLPSSPIKSSSNRHLAEVMKPILEDTSAPPNQPTGF